MIPITLKQYLLSLAHPDGLFRTLTSIEVCRNEAGEMIYASGNSAVVFKCRYQNQIRKLRCYFQAHRPLDELYGEKYLPKELYVFTTPESGQWVDVVLEHWYEGENLSEAVERAALEGDTTQLERLSEAFDLFAADLIASPIAHGDLKPENIVVSHDKGRIALHAIDWDGMYRPDLKRHTTCELGTSAYQHPQRTPQTYNASLDDFPAALIATALHSLTLRPELYARRKDCEGLIFSATTLHRDALLDELLPLFARHHRAAALRLAQKLVHAPLQIEGLSQLLRHAVTERQAPSCDEEVNPPLELFAKDSLWGYRLEDHRIVIPPIYDYAFAFTEHRAAVSIGGWWSYIDPKGRIALALDDCSAAKPFVRGRASIEQQNRIIEIDFHGKEFA